MFRKAAHFYKEFDDVFPYVALNVLFNDYKTVFRCMSWQALDQTASPHTIENVSLLWRNEAAARFTHMAPLLVGLLRHSQHISNVTAFADSSARAVRDTHNKQSRPLECLKDLHVDDTLRVLVLGNSIAALCLTWKFPTLIQAIRASI